MKEAEKKKRWVDGSTQIVLPILVVLTVIAEHCATFDWLQGLDQVAKVADRFDHTNAPDANVPVYPNDAEWKPMIEFIKKFSTVKLRADKQPLTIARKQTSAWTSEGDFDKSVAPSAPIFVFYRHWSYGEGTHKDEEDHTEIGTVGDLHNWIERSKTNRHFLINDVLLALMPIILSFWLWRINYSHRHK